MTTLPEIIQHLYEHAPGFRRRLDAAGVHPADVRSQDDLSRIPVLHKDDLIALQQADPPFAGMLAVPIGQLRRVYQSPGPINDPEPNVVDYWNWEEALLEAGFVAGDIAIVALSYHLTPAANMAEEAFRRLGVVVIPGGIGNQAQQLQLMQSVAANGYFGLPSYLKALLDKADELGYSLSLQKAFVFAEPLPETLRQEFNERGITVFQGYGTAECGNLGYEVAGQSGWRIPDSVIIQICDPQTGQPLPHGETGEVVATLLDLHYALVRFGTGDLSAIVPESVADGGGLRLEGWLGRVGLATKVRGMFLHPGQLAEMMARFPEVSAYQVVITREEHKDYLRLTAVATDPTAELGERLKSAAREMLRFRMQVDFVDALPDGESIRDERSWE